MNNTIEEIRHVLQHFQDGYSERNVAKIDQFMELFASSDDIELIGIGAAVRNRDEWFTGQERICEIIQSDWQYWGDVRLDVDSAKITAKDEVAWLSTTGSILQTDHIQSDEVTGFTLHQMKELLEDETLTPKARLVEAAHFAVRRWREREKPAGFPWPFTFTAVLVREDDQWRFHTIHWAMPVD